MQTLVNADAENRKSHLLATVETIFHCSRMYFFFSYFPCDPPYVTDELREEDSFKNALKNLRTELDNLQTDLRKSVPFFSSRYKVTRPTRLHVILR